MRQELNPLSNIQSMSNAYRASFDCDLNIAIQMIPGISCMIALLVVQMWKFH